MAAVCLLIPRSRRCCLSPGRWLGQDEKTAEERRSTLEKFGFEWRLRVKDDEYDADGNPEEFSILCEGLQVRGGREGEGAGALCPPCLKSRDTGPGIPFEMRLPRCCS